MKTKNTIIIIATTISLIISITLFAGVIRNDVAPIKYFEFAKEKQFDAVCGIVDKRGSLSASGVLISSHHVITAAHTSLLDSNEIYCRFGRERFKVSKVIKYPGYKFGKGGIDLAILKLEKIVDNVTQATINRDRNEKGKKAYISGFGTVHVAGFLPILKADGHKIAGTNMIDSLGAFNDTAGGETLLFTDFDKSKSNCCNSICSGSSTPTQMEFSTTGGDSGGGLFIRHKNTYKLAGIVKGSSNFSSKNGYGFGTMAMFTRVSIFSEWIEEAMSK